MPDEKKKSEISKREEEILSFWEENDIFKKTLEKTKGNEEFVFYDGPPFATGMPHYGHILPGTMKDVIPRYKTMRGFHVRRRWGWDCHGLPLENQVEKELDIKDKRGIEEYGIGLFNEKARSFVLRYADDWKKVIPRTGRWVDMENDYRTMDPTYTESIWWAFSKLFKDKKVYEGFKPMHICPRCVTPLSNFEVNQGYTDIKDLSVTAKFKVVDAENTYFLAWTTTPWTLPGNMALAINSGLSYIKVRATGDDGEEAFFILAKERLADVMGEHEHEIVEEISGAELVGLKYIPPFEYFRDEEIGAKENAWKVYAGDFVTTEEGTGIVHIAPAFGSDDLVLAQANNIPIVHHVTMEGVFIPEVTDFDGLHVKPKDGEGQDHMSTDVEIIKWLHAHSRLFSKEKITHSYPLCWRCDTPLINYATSSWFVEVSKMKEKLVQENEKINWVPKAIGSARFGDWLEGARDWAISRLRFWGAPLPVWKSESGDVVVLGSLSDLREKMKSSNTYFVMRHGEAKSNVEHLLDDDVENLDNTLTENGRAVALKAVQGLSGVTRIISSPLHRTKETAEIVRNELGLPESAVNVDERLRENTLGVFSGKPLEDYVNFYSSPEARMYEKPEGGESWREVKTRITSILYEIDRENEDEVILFISHNGPLQLLQAGAQGFNDKETGQAIDDDRFDLATGEIRELHFSPLPHNENFELDFHRPYIDEVEWKNAKGEVMRRVPDVFDCWFESGSMPFASWHYPFNTGDFDPEKGLYYPADFIAEGLDQTRGWFYSLLVLGVALFGKAPYKNVVVNGMILAEDGKKMSKRLGNYPDVDHVLDTYGADALRYYLMNSPSVRADTLNFSEKGVDEVVKKIILRLLNTYSFYEMYTEGESEADPRASENVLDQWVLARLHELRDEVTKGLDGYEFDRATRPFGDFVDDLSTWYVRRSRDRFKEESADSAFAQATLSFVLRETAKLLAPFMPFLAEDLYGKVGGGLESVHLEEWPDYEGDVNYDLLDIMKRVRHAVSLALDARGQEGIKVRQPLSTLTLPVVFDLPGGLKQSLLKEIAEEVNVKEVLISEDVEDITLDTELTPELIEEGHVRELMRAIQGLRKKEGLDPGDNVVLIADTDAVGKKILEAFRNDITSTASLRDIEYASVEDGVVLELDDMRFEFRVEG